MIDLRQSSQYGQYLQSLGWQTKRIDNCQIFIRRLPLIGSLLKIQRPKKIPFSKIDNLAKKCKALLVKIEPQSCNQKLFLKYGFQKDSWPLLPTKTILIDLKKTEKQLWQEARKQTRYAIKKALRKKMKIVLESKPERFWQNFKKFGRGYIPQKRQFRALIKAFGKKAILLKIRNEAGCLILIYDKTAYYYFAFTSPSGRRNLSQYLLVWEAIKRTKKLGCQFFDFEGIEDPSYSATRKWKGFSHFKKGFGGQIVSFPGSFIKIYNPLLKFIANIKAFLLPSFT